MIPVVVERPGDLRGLCLDYGIQRLELFGAAADGTHHPAKSNFDFLVEFQPTDRGSYADVTAAVM